jgi:hypothetical protein
MGEDQGSEEVIESCMRCILANLPNWIEALAASAIVLLTYLTLVVLKDYAADTKKIANASVLQTENAQKPFLVLLSKPPEIGKHGGGWALENQGFGPAMNIRHSDAGGSGQFRENVRALARDDYFFLEGFDLDVMQNQIFTAEYESLSGAKYRTVVAWPDGIMRTTFSRL